MSCPAENLSGALPAARRNKLTIERMSHPFLEQNIASAKSWNKHRVHQLMEERVMVGCYRCMVEVAGGARRCQTGGFLVLEVFVLEPVDVNPWGGHAKETTEERHVSVDVIECPLADFVVSGGRNS